MSRRPLRTVTRARRGAALLVTVVLIAAATGLSAVVVGQSLSLARAESERLSAATADVCADRLRSMFEASLVSDPSEVAAPDPELPLDGARVFEGPGTVVDAGVDAPEGVDGCRDTFTADQHRVNFTLPSATDPSLSVLYGSRQGNALTGTVVDYQQSSVSELQVWSDETLDLAKLVSTGGAEGDPSNPVAPTPEDGGPGGLLSVVTPTATSEVGTTAEPVDGMEITFEAPGGRRYRITSSMQVQNTASGEVLSHQIARNGTTVQGGLFALPNEENVFAHEVVVVDAPAAGTVTYRTVARFAENTGDNLLSPSVKPFLMVEDVGPVSPPETERTATASGLVAIAPDPATVTAPAPRLVSTVPSVPGAGTADEMSVTFTPRTGRRYQVMSYVLGFTPGSPGAALTHTVARTVSGVTTDLRSGIFAPANEVNAFSHTLAAFDAPAGGTPVTYSTRLSYTGTVGDVENFAGPGFRPFIAVFDVGPAAGPTVTAGIPAGLVATVDPVSATSPITAADTQVATVTFDSAGDRRYRITSLVQTASDEPSEVAVHKVTRDGQALPVGYGMFAPADVATAYSETLTVYDAPPAGPVTYRVTLTFTGDGSNVSSGAFTPLLAVEDIGSPPVVVADFETVLAGAVYGAGGVDVPSAPANVNYGALPVADGASSPRHLQVYSPDSAGPSSASRLTTHTRGSTDRLPTGLGGPGRGDGIDWLGTTAGMTLSATQLYASVADRISLACAAGSTAGMCLTSGTSIVSEDAGDTRPQGLVGYAAAPATQAASGSAPTSVVGQSVSFVADGTRTYRVTSVVHPRTTSASVRLTHDIVRNGTTVQRVASTLPQSVTTVDTVVTFDVPAAGPVTYATDVEFSAPGTLEVAEGSPSFVVVEDVGPAASSSTPGDGSGGLVAVSRPLATDTGFSSTPEAVVGQSVSFTADGTRRYLVVSSVRPTLDTGTSTSATHHITKASGAGSPTPALSGSVHLPAVAQPGHTTLALLDVPAAGTVTYSTALAFSAGSGSAYVDVATAQRPFIAVLDVGPAVPSTVNAVYPGGVVRDLDPDPAVVRFDAPGGRLYRVWSLAQATSTAETPIVSHDIRRGAATMQTAPVVFPGDGTPYQTVAVAVDAPTLTAGEVTYTTVASVTPSGSTAASGTFTPQLVVEDLGPASAGTTFGTVGVSLSGSTAVGSPVRSALGLVSSASAPADAPLGPTVAAVDGQTVSFDTDGTRRFRVTSVVHASADTQQLTHRIVRGAAVLQEDRLTASGTSVTSTVTTLDTPPAGRVTYTTHAGTSGSATLRSSGTSRSFIVVEDVGPVTGGASSTGAVPDGASGGLLASGSGTTTSGVTSTPVEVSGQTVSFTAAANRRYLVVSDIHVTSTGSSARHLLTRTIDGGSSGDVAAALVSTAGASVTPRSHLLQLVDTPGAGLVTYTTRVAFPSGTGSVSAAGDANPFIAVFDVGPATPAAEMSTLPAGVVATATGTTTSPAATVTASTATVTVPGGRIYRVTSVVHPSTTSTPATVTHRLLRGATALSSSSVRLDTADAPRGSTTVLIDAPSAAAGDVTYTAELVFPSTGRSTAGADGTPQLVVEDLGPARPDTTFAYTTPPSLLYGHPHPTEAAAVAADAYSYLVTFAPTPGATLMSVASCPSSVAGACTEDAATGSFVVRLYDSGLVVVPGPTTVQGASDLPFTLIAGTLERPADLRVDTAAAFTAPVQLIATDRVVLAVDAADRSLAADLVALGVASPGTPFTAAGSWTGTPVTIEGSIAAPKVDLATAFGAAGPLRITPRTHASLSPWAVGFSTVWRPVSVRPASTAELAALFDR